MRLYANYRALSLSDHGLVPVVRRGKEKFNAGIFHSSCCWSLS
jgi:hypothetical protein